MFIRYFNRPKLVTMFMIKKDEVKKSFESLCFRRWVTVAGIRSTGLTNCLPIAEYVFREISNTIKVAPSGSKITPSGKVTWWKTQNGAIVMDGVEYTVTHPITKFGLWNSVKSNELFKCQI